MLNRSLTRRLKPMVILILLCVALAANGYGQNCDSLLTLAVTDTNSIYVTSYTEVSPRELRKDLVKVQEQLLNQLREMMAAKVLLEVKTRTTSGVFESGGTFISAYNSETEIISTANLSDGEDTYCVDKKNRIVYGIYSLNRKSTALKILRDCENRMLRLVAEVKNESESSDMTDPEKFRLPFEKIKQDARVVVYLDPSSDFDLFNSQIKEFIVAFNAFKQTSKKQEFNDRIQEIEDRFIDQDYSSGLRELRYMMREYPNRKELDNLLATNERRYKMYSYQQVRNDEALRQYADALNSMNAYCSVVNCTSSDYDRIDDLRSAYFADELAKFESALKTGQTAQAANHISTLKTLASANPKGYQKAWTEYNFHLARIEMDGVERDLDQNNYQVAYAKVKQIENTYGTNYGELQSLEKTTAQRLLRSEIQKEKQTRHKLYSFGIGVSAFSNGIESVEYLEEEIHSFTFAYSTGLYRKFNYLSPQGSYASGKSDFIGLRYRLLDYRSTTDISSESVSIVDSTYRFDSELAIDGTAFRGIHYSVGVLFQDRQIIDKPIYTGELGVNLPLYPFSVQVNARAVFYGSEQVYSLSGGIFLNLDFWRRFDRSDRKMIERKFGM